MALAAGFGVDLERCDAEVFEALRQRLAEAGRKTQQEQLMAKARQRLGK